VRAHGAQLQQPWRALLVFQELSIWNSLSTCWLLNTVHQEMLLHYTNDLSATACLTSHHCCTLAASHTRHASAARAADRCGHAADRTGQDMDKMQRLTAVLSAMP
jgi:hypothetical protein